MERLPAALIAAALLFFSCGTKDADPNEAIGGTFVGHAYPETPVVDSTVRTENNHMLTFKAYDLGNDARFVVFVQQGRSGAYYRGNIRLSIEDPMGNVYTHYHNTEGEAIDKPVMWTRRVPGLHVATVSFKVAGDEYARAAFEVPLVREPVSGFLTIGVGMGILVLVALAVFLIKRRG